MKLIKTTTLVFAEGRSEKIYSVDLCEVGASQFVVNFRYGKRGAALKDGSKTVVPVALAEAERVYDKLVQQQLEKGYLPEGAPRPAPVLAPAVPTTAPRVAGELANEAQKARILERLAATGADRRWFKRPGHDKTWNLERAICAVPAFLAQLDVDDVLVLLGRPYEVTARLGLELAETRYDANAPNLALLLGMARAVYAPARARAFQWLDEHRTKVLADTALVAGLVLAPHSDTRDFARRLLRTAVLPPNVAAALVARIVTAMMALTATSADDAIARDATQTLVATLSTHLANIGPAVVKDLLAHPLSGVQELGAELLLRAASGASAGAISDEAMVQILRSEHVNVRAVGLRLLAELPDAVLAKMELLLVRLSTDKNADLRNASRPIVQRVALAYPAAGETIARALVEALLRRKLPEDAPSHVLRILKEDLRSLVAHLPTEDVWRLLQSSSAHAQELGGLLLQNVDPDALDLHQIVNLASHDILSVRQAAWAFYEKSEALVRSNMPEASRILDARWEDSRTFAFAFFRDRLGSDAFNADVIVTILDSVREDVQAFGRELAQKHFRDEDGPVLMTKLSEHPTELHARSFRLDRDRLVGGRELRSPRAAQGRRRRDEAESIPGAQEGLARNA